MDSTMTKDKICLDTSDVPELAEKLSRLGPGDKVSGTFRAALDESKDGLAVLSIEEITLKTPKAKPDASKSAAVKMFAEDDEEAVSDTSPA